MLAFKFRFHGHGSLRYVYKNGQSVRSRLVVVKYSRNPHRKRPRFAIVVSKKVLKSAVGRNRIRRRLYEIVRTSGYNEAANLDIALIVTSNEVLTMPHLELTTYIHELLDQTGLYKLPE